MVVKSSRYHWVVRYAHWLTVLAIVLAYALVDLVDDEGSEGNSPPSLMLQGHYLAGLAVLALLLPRILARLATPVPPIVPAPKTVIALAAHGLHLALYAFLLVQPILGILQVNYAGQLVSLPWVGWSLPALVGPDHAAHEFVAEVHETLGEVFYWVIGAHIAAALWHHFLVRDNTLRRML
ncbi:MULTISPECIES: cytochrome b [Rhodanobacter]|uniref:cytochrome b n=1 Tax=Rhodanobacter TaxID=75309 RepID=UPI00040CDE82|nr:MULTISPECIES: cytochrome b [Rhodanobacter]KZC20135.1 cytochrome B [Rhodanobacter denitrificans]UJJ49635.1 cytochrome b [Rhodanobacter denitrificans]UJM92349.1 cytochrome b [Rhodanobacter denitrificans]UJM95878.1 cytochrome b [Rhodanobacter denitrificans]UJN21291.1 cytochrome b [Rhodanobacter denitrificans]